MSSIAFVTHENIEKTPVCKAMFVDVARGLKCEGFDVTILSASEEGKNAPEFDNDGIRYEFFTRSSYGKFSFSALSSLLGAYGKFWSLMRAHGIVFFRSYPTILFFGFIARILGKKVIFDTRGLFFEELFDSGKLRSKSLVVPLKLLEKYLLSISHVIICVTESQKKYYSDMLKTAESRMVVIPNCAPIATIIEDRTKTDNLELGYVGSLVKWHSPELVKEICVELGRLGVSYTLTVLTRDLVRAKHLFEGLGDNVIIRSHNYRERPIRFDYGFCLISGGLSKKVCFPVKFLEYIQSGTKVINSSNVDVTKEIIEHTGFGINICLGTSAEEIAKNIIAHYKCNSTKIPEMDTIFTFDSQVTQAQAQVRKLA